MDRKVLNQWLKAGFVHDNQWYPTDEGASQGGSASPVIANQTLDGIELLIKSLARPYDKANFVRYADDFIITSNSKEFLEETVKPALKNFLATRGLTLSDEKTHITHIDEGFDFLSFNLRKYKGKLLIKPTKKNVKTFLAGIREEIKSRKGIAANELTKILNPKIRGWANYYQHVVSKRTFSYVDSQIFASIWQWSCRRHPNKGRRWIKDKYFATIDNRNWVFAATYKNSNGDRETNCLIRTNHVPICRHIKIKAEATPYDAEYRAYFEKRLKNRKKAAYKQTSNQKSCIGNNTTKHTPPKPLGHDKSGLLKA